MFKITVTPPSGWRLQNAEAMVKQERQRAEEAEARVQKLAAKLRSAGIEIDEF